MHFFLFLLISFPIFAQNNFNISNNNITISFIKQNYQADEPINLVFSIENIGTNINTFELSDMLGQSVNFELKTSKNEKLDINHETMVRLSDKFVNPTYFRTITLMPGESFTKILNLRKLYNITKNETYFVKGILYPDLYNKSNFIVSDYVSFSQTAPPLVLQKIVDDSIKRTAEIENIASLMPSEVVQCFFEAQFVRDWEKFLLYIDAERLIYSFQNFATQYEQSLDGNTKIELLDKFRRFFTVHWNISLISYSIIETVIRDDKATVTVDAIESIRFTSKKIRYNFTLYRTNTGTWMISDYTVLILN